MTEVSILIPAYRSEPFIDRALLFARGQTHTQLKILVSVDQSEDKTVARVERHAKEDGRVQLFPQENHVGWAANVNFLLSRVTTPFFFIYFDDDIILPQYTERLLFLLTAKPEAASAHCDMGHFGGSDRVSLGRLYEGDTARRLMVLMLAPYRGSPLRSLIRTEMAAHLRIFEAAGGLWANEPFLFELIAAGPALHLPETLYLRWDKRQGGMIEGWLSLATEEVFAGHKANLARMIEIIHSLTTDAGERRTLVFSLYLNMLPTLQQLERQARRRLFSHPRELHSAFSSLGPTSGLRSFGLEISGWAHQRWNTALDDLRERQDG